MTNYYLIDCDLYRGSYTAGELIEKANEMKDSDNYYSKHRASNLSLDGAIEYLQNEGYEIIKGEML